MYFTTINVHWNVFNNHKGYLNVFWTLYKYENIVLVWCFLSQYLKGIPRKHCINLVPHGPRTVFACKCRQLQGGCRATSTSRRYCGIIKSNYCYCCGINNNYCDFLRWFCKSTVHALQTFLVNSFRYWGKQTANCYKLNSSSFLIHVLIALKKGTFLVILL